MPKGSFNPELAKQGGGGVEKGKFLVKSAKLQNVKTDYRNNQMYLVLNCGVLDDNYQQVRDAEDAELRFSFGKESLTHFHPAMGKDTNDADPVDQGDAPDAEGNTFIVLNGEPVNRSTAVMVFFDSIMKHGFPKDVLNLGWAPSFVDMQFELATYTSKECNEKFGTRLNTKPLIDEQTKQEKPVTYKVCVKWQNPNYLSGNPASAGATTSAPATTASTSETDDDLAVRVIKLVVVEKNEFKSAQGVRGLVTNKFVKEKLPSSRLSKVQKLVEDVDWLVKHADAIPEYDDAGKLTKITIPA